MTTKAQKKKKNTAGELAARGGCFLLSLPILISLWVITFLSLLNSIFIVYASIVTQEDPYFWAVVIMIILGITLALLTRAAFQQLSRIGFLSKRLVRIRREQSRAGRLTQKKSAPVKRRRWGKLPSGGLDLDFDDRGQEAGSRQ